MVEPEPGRLVVAAPAQGFGYGRGDRNGMLQLIETMAASAR